MGFDIPDAITPIFADIAVYKDLRKKVNDEREMSYYLNMTRFAEKMCDYYRKVKNVK